MTKILLIGNQGQVGTELNRVLASLGTLIGVSRAEMDLTNPELIAQVIDRVRPDVVVNAAAYTAVDRAESEPELAYQINAIAPQLIAQQCRKLGSKLLQISTDYVFDGQKNVPYLEIDETNPVSVYGKSKLAGEEAIKQINCNHVILRTAWVYGCHGKGNFVKTMLRLGREREQLRVVIDQVGCPTHAADIAKAIAALIRTIADQKQLAETYHFTNLGVCSWYDFAVNIFEEASKLDYPLKIKEVIPIATAEYPTAAKRPAYSVLSTAKITGVIGHQPPYWRQSLRQMLAKFKTL